MGRPGKQLADLFERVRTTYFPRWHRGKFWRVQFGTRSRETSEDGFCDRKRRVIYIRDFIADDPHANIALLIHEITHAVTCAGHGAAFLRRMQAAADLAFTKGDHALAELLSEEVRETRTAVKASPALVYGTAENAVMMNGASWEQVLLYLTQEYCMMRAELLKQCPRLRRVYDETVRFLEQEKRVRERFELAMATGDGEVEK